MTTPTSMTDLLKRTRQGIQDKKLGAKNAYKFKGGITKIRILPSWRKDGDPTFFHPFGQTFIKDMDGSILAVIGDRRMTFGEDDTVRTLIQRAMGDAATDSQREHYKDMLAKPRELVNALILDDKEVDPTVPQLVDFSEAQFEQILEQVELNGISEEFLDLDNGFDLKVSKSGTGFGTKYSFVFDRKSTPVPKSAMENLVDIDAYIRSKFLDTERAVNAIRTLTGGSRLAIESKASTYSGTAKMAEDGEYSAVEDAHAIVDDEATVKTHVDIDKLFED